MIYLAIEDRKNGAPVVSIMGARTTEDKKVEEIEEIKANEEVQHVITVEVEKTEKNGKAYEVLEALVHLGYEEDSICSLIDQVLAAVLQRFTFSTFEEMLKSMVDKEINSGGKNLKGIMGLLLKEWKFLDGHSRYTSAEDPADILMNSIFHPNERLIKHLKEERRRR